MDKNNLEPRYTISCTAKEWELFLDALEKDPSTKPRLLRLIREASVFDEKQSEKTLKFDGVVTHSDPIRKKKDKVYQEEWKKIEESTRKLNEIVKLRPLGRTNQQLLGDPLLLRTEKLCESQLHFRLLTLEKKVQELENKLSLGEARKRILREIEKADRTKQEKSYEEYGDLA